MKRGSAANRLKIYNPHSPPLKKALRPEILGGGGGGAHILGGFKNALLQNPRDMTRGRLFSEMIRIQARKSELQAESRSYGPKSQSYSWTDPQNPNRISQKRVPNGASALLQKTPLKPS